MTTDQQAFMDAILANPADDAPRLIYADWLDEHGQAERAEFIRLGIWLAGYDDSLFTGEKKHKKWLEANPGNLKETIARMRAFSMSEKPFVDPPIPSLALSRNTQGGVEYWTPPQEQTRQRFDFFQVSFYRGFAWQIAGPWSLFSQYAKEIFGGHPITRALIHEFTTMQTALPPEVTVFLREASPRDADEYEPLSEALVNWGRAQAGLLPIHVLYPKGVA